MAAGAQSSVQNGHIRIGVDDKAILGIIENPPSSTTGLPSSSGSPFTNIRDMNTANDANGNYGSAYNVWGIAYDSTTATPVYACNGVWGACPGPPSTPWVGAKTLTPSGSCGAPATACTVVVCNTRLELKVCHDFHASPNADVVEVTVTLESLRPAAAGPLNDVLYRRSMILSPEPVTAAYANTRPLQQSWILIDGLLPVPPALVWSSDNGYNQNGPTYSYGPTGPAGSTCPFVAYPSAFNPAQPAAAWYSGATGPCVHGGLFEFNFGDIMIGSPVKFKMWLGAAASKTAAQTDVGPGPAGVGADFWALAMHPSDPTGGTPDTFIWAFGGLRPPAGSFSISHPPPPPAAAFAPTDLCLGVAATMTDTSVAGGWPLSSVLWNFGDGSPTTTSAPGASVTHTYTALGVYTVTATVMDAAGRAGVSTQTVTVYDCTPPAANFTLPAILCATKAATFTDTTPPGAYPFVKSRWIWGDGLPDTILDPYATSATHTYPGPATYSLSLSITNTIGIVGTKTVTISPCEIICPSFAFLPIQIAIEGQPFSLDVLVTDPNGPALFVDGFGPRGSSVTATTAPGPAPLSASVPFRWTPPAYSAGVYRVFMTASDTLCDTEGGFNLRVQGLAPDTDFDGIDDHSDNCPATPNHEQEDGDRNGVGDACQDQIQNAPAQAPLTHAAPGASDVDHDGIADLGDTCPNTPNADQADFDGDRIGDACDSDGDGDGVAEVAIVLGAWLDNCPTVANAGQEDADANGVGDACEAAPPGVVTPARPEGQQVPTHPFTTGTAATAFFLASFGLTLAVIGIIAIFLVRRDRR